MPVKKHSAEQIIAKLREIVKLRLLALSAGRSRPKDRLADDVAATAMIDRLVQHPR